MFLLFAIKQYASMKHAPWYMQKGFLWFLVVLDIAMAIFATVYDWNKFLALPLYVLPFVPICALYPFLIAGCLLYILHKKTIPHPLLGFTLVGTISYGIMTFIFYPLHLTFVTFDWMIIGNMAWVTAYSIQALLLRKFPLQLSAGWIVAIATYFFLKDIGDMYVIKFSYVLVDQYPYWIKEVSFVAVICIHAFLIGWLWRRHRK